MNLKIIDKYYLDFNAIERMKKAASKGIFDGRDSDTEYFKNCGWWWEKYECTIIFTRDVGYHSSGWWKNPEYEQCYHLSLAFPGGRSKSAISKIITGFFGDSQKWLWVEPPYSAEGKKAEVWHYRLFCDTNWQPIKPRGEVYSTQFTEHGWKSFSELNKKH